MELESNPNPSDSLTDLYIKLVRGCPRETIENLLNAFISGERSLNEEQLQEKVVELACFLFHLRDIRHGKGERQLFYYLIIIISNLGSYKLDDPSPICWRICELISTFPNIIPYYGSYKDYLNLITQLNKESGYYLLLDCYIPMNPLATKLLRYYSRKLAKDAKMDLETNPTISLAWKYAPNEHSKRFKWVARAICRQNLYRYSVYRRHKSRINRYLNNTELSMGDTVFSNPNPNTIQNPTSENIREIIYSEPYKPVQDALDVIKRCKNIENELKVFAKTFDR